MMNNKMPLPFPMELEKKKMQNQMKKMLEGAMRAKFQHVIQPSFLIKMKAKVMGSIEFSELAPKCYSSIKNGIFEDYGLEIAIVEDVCSHIAYIHKYYMMEFLNKAEYENESSKEGKKYQEKLKQKVLEQIRIRNLGSAHFGKKVTVGYYPYLYSTRVLVFLVLDEIRKVVERIDVSSDDSLIKFQLTTMVYVFKRASGILELLDSGCSDASYCICRQMIEFYTQYLIISKNPNSLLEYEKFQNYSFEYHSNRRYPEKYKQEFNLKFQNCTNKPDISKYLNYGWIDSIPEFSYMEDKKYTIKELFEFLDLRNKVEKNSIGVGKTLTSYYENCNLLTHANSVSVNPFFSNIEIATMVVSILKALALDLVHHCGISIMFEGVDIIDLCEKNMKEINKINDNISLNKELVKRAILA